MQQQNNRNLGQFNGLWPQSNLILFSIQLDCSPSLPTQPSSDLRLQSLLLSLHNWGLVLLVGVPIIDHLKWGHISALTGPILTRLYSWVPGTLFDRCKLSQWHLSRQDLSSQHLSLLVISQLLLARYWPNFQGRFLRFLWPSLRDANCHSHIFSMQHLSWPHLST